MSTGTVSVHSWSDNPDDDEGWPPMGANYNSRLDPRDDFNRHKSNQRDRMSGRLRSRVVRPTRFGGAEEVESDESEGAAGEGEEEEERW